MNTDILCEIDFLPKDEILAKQSLNDTFDAFRVFEGHYSRFKEGNELWYFNHSDSTKLSQEFFDLLSCAKYFHTLTKGQFDPSILTALTQEGYQGAAYNENQSIARFDSLTLNPTTLSAHKPLDLLIDLGGIGKGYIVDQVTANIGKHHRNFLVDAGGDIYARGGNQADGYEYWAIEVEHPLPEYEPAALLLLTDMAVATSGRNRRHWIKNGIMKHHLINPKTRKSASTDLLTVTVIAPSTVAADIWAKVLCMAGKKSGVALAEKYQLPALFIDEQGNMTTTTLFQNYVWKAR